MRLFDTFFNHCARSIFFLLLKKGSIPFLRKYGRSYFLRGKKLCPFLLVCCLAFLLLRFSPSRVFLWLPYDLGYLQSCTTLTFSDALCFRLHLRKTGGFPIHKASGWYKEPSNPQGHHQASKATAAPAPTVLHSRVGLGGGSSTASISTPFLLTSMAFEECVILGLEAHVVASFLRNTTSFAVVRGDSSRYR